MKKKTPYIIPNIPKGKNSYFLPPVVLQELERKSQENFRWTILYDEYIPQKTCQKEPFSYFLRHTIRELNKYEKYKWDQILRDKHSHIVGKNQKLVAEEKIKNKLKEIKKDVEIYQLKGSSLSHRIFGYREKGIFHVMLNDLNHTQTK